MTTPRVTTYTHHELHLEAARARASASRDHGYYCKAGKPAWQLRIVNDNGRDHVSLVVNFLDSCGNTCSRTVAL